MTESVNTEAIIVSKRWKKSHKYLNKHILTSARITVGWGYIPVRTNSKAGSRAALPFSKFVFCIKKELKQALMGSGLSSA